jgi:hypothetical protein
VKLTGTVCLIAGVVLIGSNLGTHLLGYAPDPAFVSLYALMWPSGIVLLALGAVLWVTAWILQGFDPDHGRPVSTYVGSVTRPEDLPPPRGTFQG